MLRVLTAIAIFMIAFKAIGASHSAPPIAVHLHPYGFPASTSTTSLNVHLGVFYLSTDQLGLFFEQPVTGSDSHVFQVIVFSTDGRRISQLVVPGDPKAIDITVGPNGGVLVGRAGQLDFYDSRLQLVRSKPLAPTTTGINFDRQWNQLVLRTVERESGHQTADFLDAKTLERSATLIYPIQSHAIFGQDQLVYTTSGECKGAARVVSNKQTWRSFDSLPACDALTFIGNESLAYAFDGNIYVTDFGGKELFKAHIPVGSTFQAPRLVGLSDDNTRLAISALKKKPFSSEWPYHDEILLYDLSFKRLIVQLSLPAGSYAAALSPDGHQLATIEQGTLMLIPIP